MTSTAYHLMLSVSDAKASKKFYNRLFKELSWKMIHEDPESAAYSDGSFTLWIVPAENKKQKKHQPKAVGFHHFAIRVQEQKEVDRMHAWCKKNKVKVLDPPAAYPQYNENYYAVFFQDPDGMKIEIAYL